MSSGYSGSPCGVPCATLAPFAPYVCSLRSAGPCQRLAGMAAVSLPVAPVNSAFKVTFQARGDRSGLCLYPT